MKRGLLGVVRLRCSRSPTGTKVNKNSGWNLEKKAYKGWLEQLLIYLPWCRNGLCVFSSHTLHLEYK